MSILDLARTDVVTVGPDDPLAGIAATMATEGVGSVVVLDDGKPRGLVTDRDLAIYGLGAEKPINELAARNVMEEDLFHVDPDDGVLEVIRGMRERKVRRAPVTRHGELVGIVTLDDLVVLLARELDGIATVIEAESPPY